MKKLIAKLIPETTLDKLRAIPHWNLFTAAKNRLASGEHTKSNILNNLALKPNTQVQERVAENSGTHYNTLELLSKHKSSDVRSAVGENEHTLQSTMQSLAGDVSSDVRYAMASNARTSSVLLEILAGDENAYVQARAMKTQARIKVERTLTSVPAVLRAKIEKVQKGEPRFTLFCRDMFANSPQMAVKEQVSVTLAQLTALPRNTQLLVAHFLEQDNCDLMLLEGDTDVCKLLSTNWLVSLASSPVGVVSFRFKPGCWRQLKSLRQLFLTQSILNELKQYRQHKTTVYPWVW